MSAPVHSRAITLVFLTLAASSAGGQGLGGGLGNMGTPAPNNNGLYITTGMDISASKPRLVNQRHARCIRSSSTNLRSLVMPYK